MNQWILFFGGTILGILLSLTLLQHDVQPPVPSGLEINALYGSAVPSSVETPQERSVSSSLPPRAPPVAEVVQKLIPPHAASTEARAADIHQHAVLTKDRDAINNLHKLKEGIRWAPGKESSLEKYRKDAANAQSAMGIQPSKASIDEIMNQLQISNYTDTNLELKLLRKMRKSSRNSESVAPVLPLQPIIAAASTTAVNSQGGVKMPAPKYHDQCLGNFSSYVPYVPTLDAELAAGKTGPDMTLQRAVYEKDNLKLHLCNGVFEAYSAAYLTTARHMIEEASDRFNLTWVNCEMASFVYMRQSNRFYKNGQLPGIIMQTLDVLDFSVIHLSAYERSTKRYMANIWKAREDQRKYWSRIDNIVYTGKILQSLNDPKVRKRSFQYSAEAQRTVVLMPFLGGAMGAGHSELGNRFEYLKTCFWSLYEFFPHIVVAVARPEDVQWAWNVSGLPFYDVLLLENLPKSAGLPVGSTQILRQRLIDKVYDFDYVFYTESDQILIARELPMLYAHLRKYPGHMLLPHRLMPYSSDAMIHGLRRDDIVDLSPEKFATTRQDEGKRVTYLHSQDMLPPLQNKWMTQSCCLPRQNCQERKSWKHLSDRSVPIIQYYGMYVPLGNVNFLREDYRYCTMSDYVGNYCP